MLTSLINLIQEERLKTIMQLTKYKSFFDNNTIVLISIF